MLRITQQTIADLVAHAQKDAPIEACGYLAERETVVAEAIPLNNLDTSPEHFTLDSAEQFTALRRMRAEGLKLKGVYHSHPATPARPSSEDIRLANDPNLSYVIVSLAECEPVIKSFRIQNGRAMEEELIIEKF
jgi:[CysO sulfur-carrier protein]-S-L-cysteine hydrolase